MTSEEDASVIAIELCRKINRSAATKYAEKGISAEDIAIAAIYSAVDLAQHFTGDPASAIAWARRALDVMEAEMPLPSETIQ